MVSTARYAMPPNSQKCIEFQRAYNILFCAGKLKYSLFVFIVYVVYILLAFIIMIVKGIANKVKGIPSRLIKNMKKTEFPS